MQRMTYDEPRSLRRVERGGRQRIPFKVRVARLTYTVREGAPTMVDGSWGYGVEHFQNTMKSHQQVKEQRGRLLILNMPLTHRNYK